jgi:hypothetical protein
MEYIYIGAAVLAVLMLIQIVNRIIENKNSSLENVVLSESETPEVRVAILSALSEVTGKKPEDIKIISVQKLEQPAISSELIAVITAAIAAATSVPADGLVVRSIRRAENSRWKRA